MNYSETNQEYSEELRNKISKYIIDILLESERTVPYRSLRFKLIEKIRADNDESYIRDDFFIDILSELIVEGKIGISNSQRYYIDYLDWPEKDGRVLTGLFRMSYQNKNSMGDSESDPKNSNWGFISEVEDISIFTPENEHELARKIGQKVSHYVHTRNVERFLPQLKNGALVKFVELDVSAKKSQKERVSKYIDARIVEVIREIQKPKISGDFVGKRVAELVNMKKIFKRSSGRKT
ncbi:hypothetical protein J2Z62_000390 [Mycoplasmoides fastidiosum]|uniref:Uncharacterized protein n=1 Tax=Mycoplasmoides fastidiosum TaxID=92758 RepID=A0ABU0LZ17_9BACT|nr:hypothetical protein [Mycoplasmoides fastidiosum]MDQ0513952.1 hypothetical protein [Mycoplasmoides fastidiosum]UUD37634.1 hypothetical protein NPA10_03645 [Mycoplasmoides fastidiosum]